ncbi:MAG: pyridoxamine 5'-phosphate oxidase family protein [Dehalococcoidia bacterium]|nr:pyridoxamine 5'-phosphate oxidase family protein [Dehalococcoidia bacterium]
MIAFTEEMRHLIDSALANNTPCLVATASRAGQPSIGPKGSVMAFDRDHLAYWERARRGLLADVTQNPQVCIYYGDRAARVFWRFYGVATVHKTGEVREAIMARTVTAEMDRDPERLGYGVLVRVEKIMNLAGQVVQER